MKKKKLKIPESEVSGLEEWNPLEGHGILPKDISLTQNIGCAAGKSTKSPSEKNNN